MSQVTIRPELQQRLAELSPDETQYATRFVDQLLAAARQSGVSDVHLQPTTKGLEIRWRLDGVLQRIGDFPAGQTSDVIARLKVLANLLTYRHDMPQEGRIRDDDASVEMRVSTFPTLHGERAVVRLFAATGRLLELDDLGFPADILQPLTQRLWDTSGALLITGPAGSGKTTTAYAALREILQSSQGRRSVVTLEDPIEVALDGVAQSQMNAAAGFDFPTGLRSLMRQDPEVILVGEVRDRTTAETTFQAALTGHLVLTTFHAGSAAGAVSRLSDMGIEPYLLRSGIRAILNQRLVRRLCDCARPGAKAADALGLDVEQFRVPVGCAQCLGTGYRGRILLAEMLCVASDALGRAILSRRDTGQLEQLAASAGMVTRWQRAGEAIKQGRTSPQEVRRVFGFTDGVSPAE